MLKSEVRSKPNERQCRGLPPSSAHPSGSRARRSLGRSSTILVAALACGGRAADADAIPAGDLGTAAQPSTLLDRMLAVMLEDVAAQPESDRRFVRFLLLTAFDDVAFAAPDGAPPRTEQERRDTVRSQRLGERLAASKAANSVSTSPELATLQAIDPLIVRLDLRDFGWNRTIDVEGATYADGWEAISARAALSVEFDGPLAGRLKDGSGSATPFLLARDFVTTAVSGELYYALLGVPGNLVELQARLTSGRLTSDDAPLGLTASYRAGFAVSGAADGIRAVERRVSSTDPSLGYWQAFDFRDPERSGAVFSLPLDFVPDGTQVIFTLPNGLPAYFMAAGTGERVARYLLPTVVDSAEPDGVQRTAASCMGCHDGRALEFWDQVRSRYAGPSPDVSEVQRREILAKYPDNAVMGELIAAANQTYERALAPFAESPWGEPVSALARSSTSPVSFEVAAGQLFVSRSEMLEAVPRLAPQMVPIRADEGSMPASAYRAAYRDLLCGLQRNARNLPAGCR